MPSPNETIIEISQTANKFRSSIVLRYEHKYIDVKSILGLYTTLLGDSKYELHVHGVDAEEARAAMGEVFKKHKLDIAIVED